MTGTVVRHVKKNEVFTVELKEMASAGYQWRFVPQEGIEVKGTKNVTDIQDEYSQAIGAPITKIFFLQANTTGEFELLFEMRRPWEKNNNVQTYQEYIDVSEDR